MFSKILVANRGEVAVRIIRACKEMGIETVAVYSEADRNSLPVALADERICIGGNAAAESYLNQKNIISAALATNAEAIHPGYGFLSENAGFAKLCEENGIVFIGPKSEVISAMGDKDTSRQLMQQVGVPVVPGTEVLKDVEEAKKYAKEIGYPLLVKATAGGGGKGIRVVAREEDLEDAFHTASREAESAFGNGEVFLEKYLTHVRHVEMQILADQQGNILCLGERDCSLQLNTCMAVICRKQIYCIFPGACALFFSTAVTLRHSRESSSYGSALVRQFWRQRRQIIPMQAQ